MKVHGVDTFDAGKLVRLFEESMNRSLFSEDHTDHGDHQDHTDHGDHTDSGT